MEGGEMMKWLGSLFCQQPVQGKKSKKLIENNSIRNRNVTLTEGDVGLTKGFYKRGLGPEEKKN